MKKILPKVIIPLVLALVVVFFVINHQDKQTIMNDSYVNGNTAGNLYNAGLFCEKDGKVYFANPDDNGSLYVMDSNGQNVSKLSTDKVMYINVDDHYIYYVRDNAHVNSSDYPYFSFNNNSLCRVDLDGKNLLILDEDPCIYASLSGNYIYYLHYDSETATTLYKVRIDGEERKKVLNYYVFDCSMLNQYFYYNGTQDDGYLYRYDTSNDSHSQISQCSCFKPIAMDSDDFFYMDVANNFNIVHLNTSYGTTTTVTTDRVDLFNLYGSTIFYQRNDESSPGLCMVKTDGSSSDELVLGTYQNINVTSTNVYFQKYGSTEIYYTSTSNPGAILTFHPGVDESFQD